MTPTKPRGGVTDAALNSAADSSHAFGAIGLPADSMEPGASPLIATTASVPTSAAEMVNWTGWSLSCNRVALTVNGSGTAAAEITDSWLLDCSVSVLGLAATVLSLAALRAVSMAAPRTGPFASGRTTT